MGDCSWRWLWGGANIPDIRDRGGGWLWVRLHGDLRWLWQHCTPSGTLLWLRGKPGGGGCRGIAEGGKEVSSDGFWRDAAVTNWYWGYFVAGFCFFPFCRASQPFYWCTVLAGKFLLSDCPFEPGAVYSSMRLPHCCAPALPWKCCINVGKASKGQFHPLLLPGSSQVMLWPYYGKGEGWRDLKLCDAWCL